MNVSLETVNHWARLSCSDFNSNRLLRVFYRRLYRNVAKRAWSSVEHQSLVSRYMSGEYVNTYPWPYCDNDFAAWEETLGSLITDQSNCVIKYSTSYCAWKIFEETGYWPHKTTKERLDAKHWERFLFEAGYRHTVHSWELLPDHRYVAIDPHEGEYGLVAWFEGFDTMGEYSVILSTYRNKHYESLLDDKSAYIWVEID